MIRRRHLSTQERVNHKEKTRGMKAAGVMVTLRGIEPLISP